jgi:ADP-ribose pyrophosphatase
MKQDVDTPILGIDDFKLDTKKSLYKGFFSMQSYTLHYKRFDGGVNGPITREIFERGNAAAIVPFDPVSQRIVLIEQFRPGAINDDKSPWLLEIVAGMIDANEQSSTTVQRELFEEAGIKCERIKFATKFYTTPGGSTESIDLYVGKVNSDEANGFHGLECECEDIRVLTVTLDEALDLIENGRICNAIAIIGIQYLALHKDAILKEWL